MTTATDVDTSIHLQKKRATIAINSVGLRLKPKKKNALIAFLACLPEILAKSATRQKVQEGFIQNGMIDKTHLKYPVFDKIRSHNQLCTHPC